jgi:hypothetical protein
LQSYDFGLQLIDCSSPPGCCRRGRRFEHEIEAFGDGVLAEAQEGEVVGCGRLVGLSQG